MTDKTPFVGQPATKLVGSDRYPFTVIEVKSPRRVVVQADRFRRVDQNGFSESQVYEMERDAEGQKFDISLRKDTYWHEVGYSTNTSCFVLGYRSAYQDPHF